MGTPNLFQVRDGGVYLDASAQMAIGEHYARLHVDWCKSLEKSVTGIMMKWGVNADFLL